MRRRPDRHGIEHEPWFVDSAVPGTESGEEVNQGAQVAEGGSTAQGAQVAEGGSTARAADDPWQLVGDEPALRGAVAADSGFHAYYLRRRAETSDLRRVVAITLAALAAGPFAIIGAIGASIGSGSFAAVLGIVLFAPIIEEVAKASGAVYLVERHPWVIRQRATLPLITLLAGLFFAVVENVLYLEVYIDDPTTTIVVWRWIAGPLLHGGAAFISGLGVAKMWGRVHAGHGLPDWSVATPFVVVAIVVHALYNLTVTILELSGFPFA